MFVSAAYVSCSLKDRVTFLLTSRSADRLNGSERVVLVLVLEVERVVMNKVNKTQSSEPSSLTSPTNHLGHTEHSSYAQGI